MSMFIPDYNTLHYYIIKHPVVLYRELRHKSFGLKNIKYECTIYNHSMEITTLQDKEEGRKAGRSNRTYVVL